MTATEQKNIISIKENILQSVVLQHWTASRSEESQNPFIDARVRHICPKEITAEDSILKWVFNKIVRGGLADLRELVSPDHQAVWYTVKNSSEKSGLLQAFERFLARTPVDQHSHMSLVNVLDELITNALYNAPIHEGHHVFADFPRSEPVVSTRPIHAGFGVDPQHVMIVVRDSWGSLTPERLIEALRRCYGTRLRVASEGTGGAGLGLFMVVQDASRLVFNLKPGEATEVIFLRKHAERRAQFGRTTPWVHICEHGGLSVKDFRRWERKPVFWNVICQLGDQQQLVGTALNASKRGLFIRLDQDSKCLIPEQEVDIRLMQSLTPTELANQGRGSILAWQHDKTEDQKIVRVTVRWVGVDKEHAIEGAGVELVQDLPDVPSD